MIVDEYHKKFNAGHPKYENMMTMLRTIFFLDMKKEVAECLSKCLESQQVKVEHQHPT